MTSGGKVEFVQGNQVVCISIMKIKASNITYWSTQDIKFTYSRTEQDRIKQDIQNLAVLGI